MGRLMSGRHEKNRDTLEVYLNERIPVDQPVEHDAEEGFVSRGFRWGLGVTFGVITALVGIAVTIGLLSLLVFIGLSYL